MSRSNDSHAPRTEAHDETTRALRIRSLNDHFRSSFTGGRVMVTAGVQALPSDHFAIALRRVATFTDFSAGNDPHDEHDFGAIEFAGLNVFWKIDYYDRDLLFGSPDPADPAITTRVLTIMLASEY